MRMKLTQRYVDHVAAPDQGETWHMDSEVPKFGVRVRSSGNSVYALRYKDSRGSDKKLTLAKTGEIKLDVARTIARERLGDLARGIDPQVAKAQARRSDTTVRALADEVMAHLASQGRSTEYIEVNGYYLKLHILPAIGQFAVADVTTRDIERIIRKLSGKQTTGNRVRALLSRMFKLAVRWDMRPDDPTLGVERYSEHPRKRHYDDRELGKLVTAIDAHGHTLPVDAIRLLLFTGARPKEVFGATWDMFNLETGVWTKPSQHTKTKVAHRVTLNSLALGVLVRLRKGCEGEGYVFPANSKPGHITTVQKLWRTIRSQAGVDNAHLYDLRKTFATRLLAQGADLATVMGLTGHTEVNTLLKHYAQPVAEKQRAAVEGLYDGIKGIGD